MNETIEIGFTDDVFESFEEVRAFGACKRRQQRGVLSDERERDGQ